MFYVCVTFVVVSNSLLSADNDAGPDADNDCAGDVAALLRRAGENRRAAETVARHLLARLENASTMVGMGPWDDYSHTARYHLLLMGKIFCYLTAIFMLQKFFKNRNISKKLKLILKNTTIDKTLTYASETGTLTKRDRKQLNIF
jgi:hypothetical protein